MDRPTDPQTADYDTDFFAWTQAQGAAIRRAGAERLNADIDWENVAEEIETLGRSDRDALESHLETILEHLLKLMVSPSRDPRADWKLSVLKARNHADRKITASLRRIVEPRLPAMHRHARKAAAIGLERDGLTLDDLPDPCPWTLDQLLDEDFWPANRQGLD